ncbi:PHP domain-containing protein [Clostridium gasigenes]|uniref:PHP domain-containing protein n=1 Tax=Clostridium gasigenes TaxID=94869 RepID=UPI0014383633|nr:PHP domain-containing protein [Clostridium gasigenes]NKF08844.1 PHP domain-containing protein [Clostridium gasigenes]QSW19530.1 PHP domain-containing protein [Clostridium gasigenes]
MKKLDLHIHSWFSDDGELTVEKIIDMAVCSHVDVIAITDHNSTRAVEPALKYAENKNIEVIPGIEIDCTFKDINLHVLGYNIDYKNLCFHELESNILNQERQASNKKIEKIIQCTGLKLDKSEVIRRAHNGVVTGELIAEILLEDETNRNSTILSPYVEEGNRSDMPYVNFYWDYFSKGKPAYVPIKFISLKETLNIIHNNGGVAVIAHPGNNLKSDLSIIDEIISEGIDGIEVFSTYHTSSQIDYFYNKAIENNLKITCGSDFHGKNKPNIQIGNFGCDSKLLSYIETSCLKN